MKLEELIRNDEDSEEKPDHELQDSDPRADQAEGAQQEEQDGDPEAQLDPYDERKQILENPYLQRFDPITQKSYNFQLHDDGMTTEYQQVMLPANNLDEHQSASIASKHGVLRFTVQRNSNQKTIVY